MKALFYLSVALFCFHVIQVNCRGAEPVPVIIDTDIGSYIDDSYAIAFALQSSEYLDVKMIMTTSDDTEMRAKILAKMLTYAGHDHIPIGIGVKNTNCTNHTLWEWAENYDLSKYKGKVYKFEEAVENMRDIITSSASVVDIIALGPMGNFPYILKMSPEIVKNARIKVMAGSIFRGYDNSTVPTAEYNVKLCPSCLDTVLRAKWVEPISLTPLDTGGVAYLTPANLRNVIYSSNNFSIVLDQHTLIWCTMDIIPCQLELGTIALPDPVAVLLALPNDTDFVEFKDLPLVVTEDGYIHVNSTGGVSTRVALTWKGGDSVGLPEYRDYITRVLSKS